jgi:hypothetical protein
MREGWRAFREPKTATNIVPPSGPRTADFPAEVGVLDVGRVRREADDAMFDFSVLAIKIEAG